MLSNNQPLHSSYLLALDCNQFSAAVEVEENSAVVTMAEMTADDLDAEIAKLQAEIEGSLTPHELAQTIQRPELRKEASQLEYIECEAYNESVDGLNCMSYDEITVDTNDLLEFENMKQQQQNNQSLSSLRSSAAPPTSHGRGLGGLLADLPNRSQQRKQITPLEPGGSRPTAPRKQASNRSTTSSNSNRSFRQHGSNNNGTSALAVELQKRDKLLSHFSQQKVPTEPQGQTPVGSVDGSVGASQPVAQSKNATSTTTTTTPQQQQKQQPAPTLAASNPKMAVQADTMANNNSCEVVPPKKKKKVIKKKVRKVRKKEPARTGPEAAGAGASSQIDDQAAALEAEIQRMQAELSTPQEAAVAPTEPIDPALQKYVKMRNIGLPDGAIRNAMERDGIDASVLEMLAPATKKPSPPLATKKAAPARPAAAASSSNTLINNDPALQKYVKMQKMGLPEGAIRNAMERDDVDPSLLLGMETAPTAAVPSPKRAAKAPARSAAPVAASKLNNDPALQKYVKMQKMGLPEGAIRNAMERDGVDPSALLDARPPAKKPPQRAPSTSGIDNETESLEAEIRRMEAEIAAAERATSVESSPPVRPPMMGLLGALEQAATKRVNRLEKTGGELIMQDIEPEVEARQSTPQLSTTMAEMISSKATARDKRLADGGEQRMRKVVIKEREEYKDDFTKIMEDAANMGRLTRLNEHTVEAVAIEKTKEEEWKSNGLLAIQWRSNHMSVIHDAARAGNELKLPEHVVSNDTEDAQEWDPDSLLEKPMSPRMAELLKLNTQVGEGQKKVDNFVLGKKEARGKAESLLIKPMQAYGNIDDVKLPRQAPPKIDPHKNAEKLSKMKKEAIKGGRPMVDISAGVAEIAWSRRARLDRPNAMPKMKEACDCPYCGTASPYQTHAYRVVERKRKEERLKKQQARLEKQQRLKEIANGNAEAEVLDVEEEEEEEIDEVERKRLERKRIREERRKLQDAVAEAEAAVAAAKAGKQAPQEAPAHAIGQSSPFVDDQPSPVEAGCRCAIM